MLDSILRALTVTLLAALGSAQKAARLPAPVSPLGQRAYVTTQYATYVALPTNMTIHYDRERPPENLEQDMHPMYRYAFVTDLYEPLLADGEVLSTCEQFLLHVSLESRKTCAPRADVEARLMALAKAHEEAEE